MAQSGNEGRDPAARDAARAWQERFGREGHEGSYARHDEAYASYRERHLAELDRDYDEWCRNNEERFHSEFDDWRSKRRTGLDPAGLQPGMAMTNDPGDSSTLAEDHAADALVTAEAQGDTARSRRPRR
jgi:hypothetical protein